VRAAGAAAENEGTEAMRSGPLARDPKDADAVGVWFSTVMALAPISPRTHLDSGYSAGQYEQAAAVQERPQISHNESQR